MSTIYGIFQLDNKPIAEAEAHCMEAAMLHWPPDDRGLIICGDIILGHLMLHNTPESLVEKLPLEADEKIITADCRLDNRDQILKLLQEFSFITSETPDSVLILFLYKKFGEDCLTYLQGDFVFVIYDKEAKSIFCARDQMGVKPFYYYLDKAVFVFASEKKGILSLDTINKELNETFIYELMLRIEPELAQTFYKHIFCLLPGHKIVIQGGIVKVSEYWKISIPPILKLKNVADYQEAFLEEVTRAVRCRLRTVFPIATELSGGLDSSGITGLAARLISDKNQLFTFSNVMPFNERGEKEYPDEEEFIDEIIAFHGIKNFVKNRGGDWTDFLEPIKLTLDVNDGVEVYSAWWQEPLRKKMAEKGIRVTLSGFPGDEAITNNGSFYFHDMIQEGNYLAFLKIAFQKRQYSLPIRKIFKKRMSPALLHSIQKLQSSKARTDHYLLDPDLERKLISAFDKRQVPPPETYKAYIAARVTRDHTSQRMQSETLFGIRHRLEPRYPMADTRLLSFFLSLPSSQIGHPEISRFLFRRSMVGIIPDRVRLRNDKTGAPLIYYWIENQKDAAALFSWLMTKKQQVKGPILEKLNMQKLLDGFDEKNQENYKRLIFNPRRMLEMEQLLQYLS